MSEHKATITWKRTSPDFLKGKYSREHSWTFDGGLTIPASPSPSVVPVPYSNPAHVDPEEAYVASISSCHMLTFLFIASQQGFQVDSYEDEAIGAMTKNEKGVPWVSSVTLNPESLIENWERCCGLGFWIWARRSRRSIPGAGCDACDNEGQSQKTCRPEGFRVNGRLASLLLSRRPTRGYGLPKPCESVSPKCVVRCRALQSPSSRLAIQPLTRKQHHSQFSDRLLAAREHKDRKEADYNSPSHREECGI